MTTAPLRIVVADDDAMLREMLSGLLEDLGYDIVAAVGDGASAVSAAVELRPDVALLDHRMPVLTGIEAARQLHAQLPLLPIVILSAYDDAGLQNAAREAGASRYLVKGCTAAQIAEAVEDAHATAVAARPSSQDGPDTAPAASDTQPAGEPPGPSPRPPGQRPSPNSRTRV